MKTKATRKNLTHKESFLLITWLKEHLEEFDGLYYRDVTELANAENVIEREVTANQVENLCQQLGMQWTRPTNNRGFSALEFRALIGRVESLENQVAALVKTSMFIDIPNGEAK